MLPAEILEYEVWPFLTLFEEAMMDVESEDSDNITAKWGRKFERMYPFEYQCWIESKLGTLNGETAPFDDNLLVVLFMSGHAHLPGLWKHIRVEGTALLYAMLLRDFHPTKILRRIMSLPYKCFLPVLYLFQQGATIARQAIVAYLILRTNDMTLYYTSLVKFLCWHPHVYGSTMCILNMKYSSHHDHEEILYRFILRRNPVFALELLDIPGLDLCVEYTQYGDYHNYLYDTWQFMTRESRESQTVIYYQQILREIYKRAPETLSLQHPWSMIFNEEQVLRALSRVL